MKTSGTTSGNLLIVSPHVVLASAVAIAQIGTAAQAQGDRAKAEAQARQLYKTLPPARTIYNRERKAIRITLTDRASTVLLPPGWKCKSRSMAHRVGHRRLGRYEHFLSPGLSPARGPRGIFIMILHDSNGSYGAMLDASRAQPRADGLVYRPWTLKGHTGLLLQVPPGATAVARYKDFLDVRHSPRYVLAVGTPYRLYGLEDSTPHGTPGSRTVLDSFQPR